MLPEQKSDFGHCIVPRGTLLYRSIQVDSKCSDCMFFGLDFWLASVFHNTIQVWRVKKPIELIFLCESVDWRSWTKSAIPRLYRHVFPSQRIDLDDLDIKHFDHTRRDKFIAKLASSYNINGWFAPMEENAELEICLFDCEYVQGHIELVDVKSSGDTTYYKNSLRDIEVCPPQAFYERSYVLLQRHHGGSTDRSLYSEKYRQWRDVLIHDLVQSGEEVLRSHERYFHLREKLQF